MRVLFYTAAAIAAQVATIAQAVKLTDEMPVYNEFAQLLDAAKSPCDECVRVSASMPKGEYGTEIGKSAPSELTDALSKAILNKKAELEGATKEDKAQKALIEQAKKNSDEAAKAA
mmetsp:Transcript_16446/g.20840  ORF Transcript_16446/g.20840 Transcript_16446/m.20840 type:complete len:116 (+) Transcript_16446:39-386(+)